MTAGSVRLTSDSSFESRSSGCDNVSMCPLRRPLANRPSAPIRGTRVKVSSISSTSESRFGDGWLCRQRERARRKRLLCEQRTDRADGWLAVHGGAIPPALGGGGGGGRPSGGGLVFVRRRRGRGRLGDLAGGGDKVMQAHLPVCQDDLVLLGVKWNPIGSRLPGNKTQKSTRKEEAQPAGTPAQRRLGSLHFRLDKLISP